ncbi:hypothetical protein Tsubulata_019335 [Turnera subulata]|uniref:F-box domain-containing protein n=1 Tax=Turnera subulata TaxID=218843 RepID=A0A9Q0GF30_9ROSI|nr:hypothetical protein Tsubulata_019335 [Turnera subulata]
MENLTLPTVIVEEILAKLPNKSIHRFRQLSKSWSSFLVSLEFQKLRNNKSTPPETKLQKILQCSTVDDGHVIESLGCLGDREDLVRLQFPTDKFVRFLGSCNGLVCVAVGDNESGVEEIVVWNPFTGICRKLQDIDHDGRICACGFGYDSEADDYKVFIASKPALDGAVAKIFSFLKMKNKTRVDIFSLRTGSWKEVEATGGNYVEHIAEEHEVGLFLNGALHWEVWAGRKTKIVGFDLAKEKFYDVSVLVLPQELVLHVEDPVLRRLRCKRLGVVGEYLCMSFFGRSGDIVLWVVYVMEEYCNGGSWVEFFGYVPFGCVGSIYFMRDFIPQAVKYGGYMVLHFPGGVQHILKYDNLEETDASVGLISKEKFVIKQIKFSEYRESIAYTEAFTSPYAPLEFKQLQV